MATLQERIDNREVIILDGAVGTELQRMGVPMDDAAWCATALKTHPDTIRRLHEAYIQAGADIITTNFFSSARHNLEKAGLGGLVRELNTRAVALALEARENAVGDRAVYVAGSLSTSGAFLARVGRPVPPVDQLRANYREQAELLAEAGVELILLEMMMDIEQATYALEAALATGLPTWVGFSCTVRGDGAVILLDESGADVTFAQALDTLMPLGGAVVSVMHTTIEDATPALRVALDRRRWPVGAYPHSGEWDRPNWQFENVMAPEEYLTQARKWVQMGVQIIGGCCGTGPQHIKLLRERLPTLAGAP